LTLLRLPVIAVALVAWSLALAAPVAAYEFISASGPITGIDVGDDLSCQVSFRGDVDYQFYPPDTYPGDCGTFLAVDGTLYSPDFESHDRSATAGLGSYVPFTSLRQDAPNGTGTAADPYRVVTVVEAGDSGLRLTETTSYVEGSNAYRITVDVNNLSGSAKTAVLYHAGDCYASGSDIGYGFTRPEVGSAGCSQTAQNDPRARTIQMSPLATGSTFMEAGYRQIWEHIATRSPFPDTCRCGEHIDNGVGLSWTLTLAPGASATRSLEVAFTESTPPPPGLDSDGDALPDAWETGAAPAADYQNLAPLGADPNRKDIFVHADHMAGCEPRPGWERLAIDAFAEHGIALHIDSGPDSINADGRPWGSMSRAGAIPFQQDLSVWGESFDRLKDERFIPANRRRAFHYAVFANSYNGGETGGLSRGSPDADFLMATCSNLLHVGVTKEEWDRVAFIHELGHNLGLRHGGADDVNNKPNYYGIMNYRWAFRGGIELPGKSGRHPSFSDSLRPTLDENRVDERAMTPLPVAWTCPRSGINTFELGTGSRAIDFNCNGVVGDRPFKADLNRDNSMSLLSGHHDWNALQFSGGGVIGALDLPVRVDTPAAVPELTREEMAQAQADETRFKRLRRRQLVITSKTRRLRARRRATIRVRVVAANKPVRRATIRVRGATTRGRRVRTNRRGWARLDVRPRRRRDATILASRRGFKRGGLVLPVRR
jgi:hypothetical protein